MPSTGSTTTTCQAATAMWPRCLTVLLAGPVTALPAGCNDDVGLSRVSATLEVESSIDFGTIQVGTQAKRELRLRNEGDGPLNVVAIEAGPDFSTSTCEFGVQAGDFVLGSRQERTLEVRFLPLSETDRTCTSSFVIETDAPDPERPGQTQAAAVSLRGEGTRWALRVSPNPTDFGTVLLGSSAGAEITLTNVLDVAVLVTTRDRDRARPIVRGQDGTGEFTIENQLWTGGSLLAPGSMLEPGATLAVSARYAPADKAAQRSDRGRWRVSTCAESFCAQPIDLVGRGTDSALSCSPAAIDFGRVHPGGTRRLEATCANLSAATVEVSWRLDAMSGIELSVPATLSSSVAPGGSFTIPVDFAPTQTTYDIGAAVRGRLMITALLPGRGALAPAAVELLGAAGGPVIYIAPDRLSFGAVAVGTTHTKRLLVENQGYDPLRITEVRDDTAGTGVFAANTTAFALAAGTSTVVSVQYAPNAEGADASQVVFVSDDTSNPEVTVDVDGRGRTLGPCAFRLTPPRLSFGAVPFGERPERNVRIDNVGTVDCLLNDVAIHAPSPTATTAFELVNGEETGLIIAPGAAHDVPIRYLPAQAGGDRADLGFYISDPANPNPTVPLYGVGESLTQIECPAAVTTAAGSAVTLSANGAAIGGTVTGYRWAIIAAPNGGIGTPGQWTPDPPTAATEIFLAYLVGTYDIQISVLDAQGGIASCITSVVVEGRGLQVTMTWDGPGDIDLHLHNGNQTPWFAQDDCYYANRQPAWDPAQPTFTGPNPELDFDNTVSLGPENTRIHDPVVGMVYTVAAHNFAAGQGRQVATEIYCGGGTIPVGAFNSRPMAGTDGGNCTPNDFWKVATVVFTAPGRCTVTPIDTYGPSSDACIAF